MRPRFATTPALLALVLGVALLLWLALGDMQGFRDTPPSQSDTQSQDRVRVEVDMSRAEPHTPQLIVQGQLEPQREVTLRARRAGTVDTLPHPQGALVEAGDVLLELDQQDLAAQLARAEAELKLRQAELEAGQRLRGRELVAGNELLRLESALAQARAELASLRQTLDDTRIKAPFSGRLDRLDIEEGDYVQLGEELGSLVQIERLTAEAWAPQRRASELDAGLPVTATLLDGQQLQGQLSFVASNADESTRSYALEATLDNPERRRIAGASATLSVTLPERMAHRISPARLVLDDQGHLGVKYVDEDDTVRFTPVTLLTADATQAWVTGLPQQVRLITLGGGFVEAGDQVTPVNVSSDDKQT